jgi:hypothetical protein
MNHRKWFFVMTLTSIAALDAPVAADEPEVPSISVPLWRDAFATHQFVPPKATKSHNHFWLLVNGGWNQVENHVCAFLQQSGFYTVGSTLENTLRLDLPNPR